MALLDQETNASPPRYKSAGVKILKILHKHGFILKENIQGSFDEGFQQVCFARNMIPGK